MYSIITIDGVDGSGKNTVSGEIQKILEDRGYEVIRISPPFYDTPTGAIVSDYLHDRYGGVNDRWMISQLYSYDRNMWMRDNFHLFTTSNYRYFNSDSKRIFLYNRNWISNLLYQTTLELQTDGTRDTIFDPYIAAINNAGSTFFFNLKMAGRWYYGDFADPFKSFFSKRTISKTALHSLMTLNRLDRMIHMIHNLYGMEIAPWKSINRVVDDDKWSDMFPVDFVQAADHVINVVLTPYNRGLHVIYDNMGKRYGGDSSKLDLNEKSEVYMASVIENIHWINRVWNMSPEILKRHQNLVNRFFREPDARVFETNIIPLKDTEKRAFQYDIIHTTDFDTNEQLSVNEVVDKVMHKINVSLQSK